MATVYKSVYSGVKTDALLKKLDEADFDEFTEMYNEVVEDFEAIDSKISSASDVATRLNGAITQGERTINEAAATAASATAAAQEVLDSIPADYSTTVAQVSRNTTAIAQKGQKPIAQTITLSSSSWSSNSITVSVTGVTSSNTVIVAPSDRTSAETWGDCEVMCTAQASSTLTFTCSDTPSENITVSVVILS